MLDLTAPLQTRDGREARVYATGGSGFFSVHGAVRLEDGWVAATWTAQGKSSAIEGAESCGDLVNVSTKRVLARWANVYEDGHVELFHIRGIADEGSYGCRRSACVLVEIPFTPGEGL